VFDICYGIFVLFLLLWKKLTLKGKNLFSKVAKIIKHFSAI